MSKRKPDPATYEMIDDEPELTELGEVAERIRRTLEDNGITRTDVFATMPEAKRRAFERNYPNLAAKKRNRVA